MNAADTHTITTATRAAQEFGAPVTLTRAECACGWRSAWHAPRPDLPLSPVELAGERHVRAMTGLQAMLAKAAERRTEVA